VAVTVEAATAVSAALPVVPIVGRAATVRPCPGAARVDAHVREMSGLGTVLPGTPEV
jgi:hypothetical protein